MHVGPRFVRPQIPWHGPYKIELLGRNGGELVKEVARPAGTQSIAFHVTTDDGHMLRMQAATGLDELWLDWTEEVPIRPGIINDLCGHAAAFRTVSGAADIRDPVCEGFRKLADFVGIKALWSLPILDVHGWVIGTISMYYERTHRPTPEQLRRIERAAERVAG